MIGHGIVETSETHPVLREPLEVDVGQHDLLLGGEPLGLGEKFVVLVDDRVAIPGEIGGGFAGTGRGVEIGGDTSAGLRRAKVAAVVGLSDGDIARGEIGRARWLQRGRHRCSAESGVHTSSQIST